MLSQIKDINHIKRDFHSVAWVIKPGGGTWGCLGSKFIFSENGHVAYQIEGECDVEQDTSKIFTLMPNW